MMGQNESEAGWDIANDAVSIARSVGAVIDCTEIFPHTSGIPVVVYAYPVPPAALSAVTCSVDNYEVVILCSVKGSSVSCSVYLQFEGDPISGPYFRMQYEAASRVHSVSVARAKMPEGDILLTPYIIDAAVTMVLSSFCISNLEGEVWGLEEGDLNNSVSPWFQRRLVLNWEMVEDEGFEMGVTDPIAIIHEMAQHCGPSVSLSKIKRMDLC
ncbi:MAG: hypothetical protein COA69_09610 [Robiginitomaculum sp.]|nr:MAG: hypothetical protein COA69_09610 [Robiginitomaculum sp.]